MTKLIACAFLFGTPFLCGAEFCAVRLNVLSASGRPIPAVASLIDAKGIVVSSVSGEAGSVDFCDFDFGTHIIAVESPGYMKTSIEGVRISYTRPQVLTVILNSYSWGDGGTTGCTVHFRVKDSDGSNLPFPVLTGRDAQAKEQGDRYGRIVAIVLLGNQRVFSIRADGYKATDTSVVCDSSDLIERTVVLRRNE